MGPVARLSPLLAALVLAGAGCAATPTAAPPLPTSPPEAAAPASGADAVPRTEKAYYLAYTKAEFDRARAAGRPILLYFWAAWCPICKIEEPKVRAAVEGMEIPVVGFRVDYDTEKALKDAYRIPYQHTTVILNGAGEEFARFLGPTPRGELQNALRNAAEL